MTFIYDEKIKINDKYYLIADLTYVFVKQFSRPSNLQNNFFLYKTNGFNNIIYSFLVDNYFQTSLNHPNKKINISSSSGKTISFSKIDLDLSIGEIDDSGLIFFYNIYYYCDDNKYFNSILRDINDFNFSYSS